MVVAFMFANSFLIDWNAHLHFPGDMQGFETWARSKENELKVVTDFLTRFTSFGDFMIGFVVIVLIPAFGEELLFRGIIQNKLENITGNGHVAIWFTAILFSAFHFQFFGCIPFILFCRINMSTFCAFHFYGFPCTSFCHFSVLCLILNFSK